ncbi:cyclin-dependent kinase 5 activator 2b [Astyanax mexicanus]|uniref:cyclin-dependent kinase 5 activator 2b n=1 Tax=Astyanax mexicanus TaxID=7994 RepID=UPI0020CB5994|nr:cyclin-dependent kinase 5 activator 2b [Astyanax mexicanus]
MGTVLSINPSSGLNDGSEPGSEHGGGILKKPSVIVSTLSFKRLVTASAKKKNAMKVNPNPAPLPAPPPPQTQTQSQSQSQPLAVPIPTVPPAQKVEPDPAEVKTQKQIQKQASTNSLITRVVVQASTGELLRCLGEFVCRRCFRLKELNPNEVILWFRNVDRTLLMQGWQDQGFITPATLVFVYLLCRETVSEDIDSQCHLQGMFLTCLYLAYSYLGNEISYPLKPFISEGNKDVFWDQSLGVIDNTSDKMLLINMDPQYFTQVFQDLKNEGETKKDGSDVER